MSMIMELFSHRDYLRILSAIRRKPKRFGQLQKALRLNPAQVDRALKFLRKWLWIVPRVASSGKGRLVVEYGIGKRGAAFLDSFQAFRNGALRRKAALGDSVAAEIESFTR
jgi:DNA-binding HxlR family transcriptional regulator